MYWRPSQTPSKRWRTAPPPDGIIRDAALLRIEFVSVTADTLTTGH